MNTVNLVHEPKIAPGKNQVTGITESTILRGDAERLLARLPSGFFRCCVTSPPYWGLRDYRTDDQIGAEDSPDDYVDRLVAVFDQVRRVLTEDGTLWLNIGDSYTSGNRGYRAPDKKNPVRAMSYRAKTPEGLKPKDLIGIPWQLAFALQEAGWYLRTDIIWEKPNCMPESVKDRPTRSHETIFLLSKSPKYYYDHVSARESNGRNRRTVWSIPTEPFPGAHFATFPCALVEPCIMAGSKAGDWVLDPFFGSGTVGVVCEQQRRNYVGIELNPEYVELARERIRNTDRLLFPYDMECTG
uniref:Methyltransferase n=1 Tax=Candidatus Kentrum sp. SD TaxID=2126332 RepID=A0A450YVC9_9GAMM|nr:MAG: site-specific DNA-methyltransferase (adenine-specific) [Candidatus Kentron sp. SD]VFK45465.1 MAG: site-specific DNA-methyltransferase (adenine-specific) [Candidatus Kentron sp. SD]VFK77942.1 MAG: site-specific DNA-methyltransferase (adenine-specific) [Candidatus Kentron sp. SD]